MKKILSLLLCINFIAPAQNLSTSLTACYNLNANTIDPVNGLNGNWINGIVNVTADRFNAANSAVYAIGTHTSCITLPNNTLLKPNNEITFSCWVKFSAFNPANTILFTRNNQSGNINLGAYELSLKLTGSVFTFVASKSGSAGTNSVSSTTALGNQTWYHVLFTIDNSSIKIYVNGVLEGTTATTFSGFDYSNIGKVYVGSANTGTNSTAMIGAIDNLRFYNRAISATEALLIYQQDPSCYSSPPLPPSCNNTYYTVSEGAIYAYHYGSTINPTLIPVVLPAGALGLAVGPSFSFTAPNPTYWVTAGGTYWYFNGTGFVNTNDSVGIGATNIGASAHFLYAQNATTGNVYKYNGSGNANYLTSFSSVASLYDLVGDDMDNFYVVNYWNPIASNIPNITIYNSQGIERCLIQVNNSNNAGTLAAGFAMDSLHFVMQRTQNFYIGGQMSSLALSQSTYSQPGINDFGSCPFTTNFSVTLSAPMVSLTCASPSISIYANSNSGYFLSQLNYTWTTPNGIYPYSSTLLAGLPGSYSCNVYNSCSGKYGSASIVIPMGNAPLIPTISPTKTINCFPGTGLNLYASGATNYTWYPGALNVTSISVNPTVTTIYTLQANGTGTCAGNSTVLIAVAAKPNLVISASNQTICTGSSATLTASGGSSYVWKPNFLNTPSIIVTPYITQTFSLTGGGSHYACPGSTQITIYVDPTPTMAASPSMTVCVGASIQLLAYGSTTYTWQPGNLSGNNLTLYPTSTTIYTVNGMDPPVVCVGTETVSVTVSVCTGLVGDGESQQLNYYPNPFNDFINIDCAEDTEIEVYSLEGKLVFKSKFFKGKHTLLLNNVPLGLNTLKLITNSSTKNVKLVRVDGL